MTQKISPEVFASAARIASATRALSASDIMPLSYQLPDAPPPPDDPPPPEKLSDELEELHELDDEPDDDVSNTSIQDDRPESLLPFFFFRFGSQPIQIAKVTARLI